MLLKVAYHDTKKVKISINTGFSYEFAYSDQHPIGIAGINAVTWRFILLSNPDGFCSVTWLCIANLFI